MKILRVVAVAMLLIPAVSFAQGTKKELNPWIDCGIGAMIFDETSWAAVISNIIWDLGTTAVISDSLSQQTCNSKKAKTAAYIGTTYANLSEEIAKGDGQHLRAMLDVRGCSADSHQSILSSLRGDFAQSLRDVSYSAKPSVTKAEDFYNLLEGKISTEYRQACSA
jgi:hypothetical protein